MSFTKIILGLLLAGVATKWVVHGLQCYVCENCSEYEDFKELHICGEIPTETLMKPTTSMTGVTNMPTDISPTKSSSKPTVKPSIDDYSYEDSGENYNETISQNSVPMKTTKSATTKSATTKSVTTKSVTTKPATTKTTSSTTSATKSSVTKISNFSSETSTTKSTRTTRSLTTSSQQEITKLFSSESKKTTSAITSVATTKPKPKPITPDYDDYLEYEDPLKMEERSETTLLKINEPVCYMIKYYVNDTVFTNRGCTTFVNANKYSTCQSLYNGFPMKSCRICSANGCNKFLNDDADEDHHGLYNDAAGTPKYFGVFMLIFWVLFSREII